MGFGFAEQAWTFFLADAMINPQYKQGTDHFTDIFTVTHRPERVLTGLSVYITSIVFMMLHSTVTNTIAGKQHTCKGGGAYLAAQQLEGLLGGHVVLLQQVPFLGKQGVIIGDGGRNCHLVVRVLLVYNAVV